jgi:hypothetical protein
LVWLAGDEVAARFDSPAGRVSPAARAGGNSNTAALLRALIAEIEKPEPTLASDCRHDG